MHVRYTKSNPALLSSVYMWLSTLYNCSVWIFFGPGPVIDVNSVVVFDIKVGSLPVIILQWQLAENSLPATGGYRIIQQEEGGTTFPFEIEMSTTSHQFGNLRGDLRYTFTITAVLESGATSPPITQIWEGDGGGFIAMHCTEYKEN